MKELRGNSVILQKAEAAPATVNGVSKPYATGVLPWEGGFDVASHKPGDLPWIECQQTGCSGNGLSGQNFPVFWLSHMPPITSGRKFYVQDS